MIDIILAEDHNIVRNGLKTLLQIYPEFRVTAEAQNGQEVMKFLSDGTHADVILIDMNMPVMNGSELLCQLKILYPRIKTIFLSALDHEKYVLQAIQSGVDGYLLKSIDVRELKFAIEHVFEGRRYICSELTDKLITKFSNLPAHLNSEKALDSDFSDRELEVLRLLAEGYTNQEIADALFSSKRTIEGHRQSMIDKAGVRNTAALIRYVVSQGIIN